MLTNSFRNFRRIVGNIQLFTHISFNFTLNRMASPGFSTKKRPTKIEEMTKEQIREAIKKKQESNAKALTIVESLLEKNIADSYLLQCLPDINQSHFDDVIEERSIIHLCGYPPCGKTISDKDIPKQKYRISVKTNKVYDITGRKSFCSNRCYNAAMFVKKQMLTSPLWYREYEVIPTFHLLPSDSTGCMGQEIDVSIIEKVKVAEPPAFTSINDFAKASLNEIAPNEKNEDAKETQQMVTDDNKEIPTLKADSKVALKQEETKRKPAPNHLSILGEIIEKPERKIDPILVSEPEREPVIRVKKVPQKKQPSISTITIEVEKCLAEWFTLDTLMFLLGEEKVREMVSDKSDCIKEYLDNYAKSIFHSSNSYDQYLALCRKLNLLELEEKKFDAKVAQRETKPLPDYSMLQEESKRMQLKVKVYLEGKMDIPEPSPTVSNTEMEDSDLTKLPLVDKNAQNALRRRIVCTQLNKVLPDLLRSLGMSTLTLTTDVRYLVNTFKLNADNIMFKPIQWTLISMIILKLLSLRDPRLVYLLEKPTAFQHLQLLLLSYKQDGGYIDRLITWLTDIDRLLDTNDTQLTIE